MKITPLISILVLVYSEKIDFIDSLNLTPCKSKFIVITTDDLIKCIEGRTLKSTKDDFDGFL